MTKLIIEADLSSEELQVLISEITILHQDVFKKPLVLQQTDVSGSLPYAQFMSEVDRMHKLYDNCKFGLAEKLRDELCDELDNLMRFGGNDR